MLDKKRVGTGRSERRRKRKKEEKGKDELLKQEQG